VVKNELSKLGEDGASVNERGCAVERATQCMVGEHDDSLSQQHQKCLRQFMASKIVRWQAERATLQKSLQSRLVLAEIC
jgi:hypothetical protein